MTQITIRNLDDAIRLKLKTLAAAKGRSLEAELREIITRAAAEPQASPNAGGSIRERLRRHGGFDLEIPPRDQARAVPEFE